MVSHGYVPNTITDWINISYNQLNISKIFPDRNPHNAYYSINLYMNEHNCSFEQAVEALKKTDIKIRK